MPKTFVNEKLNTAVASMYHKRYLKPVLTFTTFFYLFCKYSTHIFLKFLSLSTFKEYFELTVQVLRKDIFNILLTETL